MLYKKWILIILISIGTYSTIHAQSGNSATLTSEKGIDMFKIETPIELLKPFLYEIERIKYPRVPRKFQLTTFRFFKVDLKAAKLTDYHGWPIDSIHLMFDGIKEKNHPIHHQNLFWVTVYLSPSDDESAVENFKGRLSNHFGEPAFMEDTAHQLLPIFLWYTPQCNATASFESSKKGEDFHYTLRVEFTRPMDLE